MCGVFAGSLGFFEVAENGTRGGDAGFIIAETEAGGGGDFVVLENFFEGFLGAEVPGWAGCARDAEGFGGFGDGGWCCGSLFWVDEFLNGAGGEFVGEFGYVTFEDGEGAGGDVYQGYADSGRIAEIGG